MSGEELKISRESFNITQDELAKMIGVSRKTINTYENSSDIPISKQKLFVSVFEKFSNKMLHNNEALLKNKGLVKSGEFLERTQIGVPYYDIDFAGGWNSEELFTSQLPTFNITSPDFQKAEFACNLIGNSISRRIPHRAIIGLKEIQDWEIYFPTNELYAVLMKNELRTVKVVKRGKSKDSIILIPDPLPEHNQTVYEPEEVPITFVSKFFQVVAWAQFEKLAM